MVDVTWAGTHIEVKPPRRPKKLTGTRFAAVLGLSPWNSPFKIWCEVTRTYEEPFEDTIYTIAGKVIEPKQAAYIRDVYMMESMQSPTDMYGPDYFKKTYGDFFPEQRVFGGMWDYLLMDEHGKPCAVYEMKTTKRAEDWTDDIPEYYALQAALYAKLLGVDQVYMVCSLLGQQDYENPDAFVPSAQNTFIRPFKVSERYPHMDKMMDMAMDWWKTYVTTGISPDFDEKKDAKILKELRTNSFDDTPEEFDRLIQQAEALQTKIDVMKEQMGPIEKQLKDLNAKIKKVLESQFRDGDKSTVYRGAGHTWTLSRSTSMKLDENKLEEDGLLEMYSVPTTTYRLSITKNKTEE